MYAKFKNWTLFSVASVFEVKIIHIKIVVFRLARHFVLEHITSIYTYIYWRASGASETVFGVDNAKSGICIGYITRWRSVWDLHNRGPKARG